MTLEEIANEVKKENEDITFTMVAEARDYRESLCMQKGVGEVEVVS